MARRDLVLIPVVVQIFTNVALRWFIITGEYPPQPGGISDYTRVVASALAAAGDEVEIWTGPLRGSGAEATRTAEGIDVHRTSDHFGRQARAEMAAALRRGGAGTRVLVQYEPYSFGYRGLNVPFAWWLQRQRRRRPDLSLTVMFHEVATGWGRGHRLKQSVHGITTHAMAALTARAADRIFMSVYAWEPTLRALVRADQTPRWLPAPSNVPRRADAARTAPLRAQVLASAGRDAAGGLIVGHFSTFLGEIPKMLRAMLPQLLASEACGAILFVGRGGSEFAAAVRKEYPQSAARLIAPGEMDLATISQYLAVCDLLVQPYPDGVSSRRTTTMAGLNLGCPIVTNFGHCSDPRLWAESGAVRLVQSVDPSEIARAAVDLMNQPSERAALRNRAQQFYDATFSVERVAAVLREA